MKIAYLADHKICNKDILFPAIIAGPNGQPDFDKAPIIPATLFHIKEEFESILDRIEENMDLK
ncbi:MAG: hypothetical protein IPP15_08180 [Saprospiraceae bacterium]|uniref:Uncharacterized protein n=1 Tax=Candidatus Opimibacter skivensis TaxID=2982028 RepID=A0A9D7SUT9_9BACT|nr:hypothetical protein [Candidatus Opimibacter skivensis]